MICIVPMAAVYAVEFKGGANIIIKSTLLKPAKVNLIAIQNIGDEYYGKLPLQPIKKGTTYSVDFGEEVKSGDLPIKIRNFVIAFENNDKTLWQSFILYIPILKGPSLGDSATDCGDDGRCLSPGMAKKGQKIYCIDKNASDLTGAKSKTGATPTIVFRTYQPSYQDEGDPSQMWCGD